MAVEEVGAVLYGEVLPQAQQQQGRANGYRKTAITAVEKAASCHRYVLGRRRLTGSLPWSDDESVEAESVAKYGALQIVRFATPHCGVGSTSGLSPLQESAVELPKRHPPQSRPVGNQPKCLLFARRDSGVTIGSDQPRDTEIGNFQCEAGKLYW